jgi:hypothetical protein
MCSINNRKKLYKKNNNNKKNTHKIQSLAYMPFKENWKVEKNIKDIKHGL